jgi:hypothetical protein
MLCFALCTALCWLSCEWLFPSWTWWLGVKRGKVCKSCLKASHLSLQYPCLWGAIYSGVQCGALLWCAVLCCGMHHYFVCSTVLYCASLLHRVVSYSHGIGAATFYYNLVDHCGLAWGTRFHSTAIQFISLHDYLYPVSKGYIVLNCALLQVRFNDIATVAAGLTTHYNTTVQCLLCVH